MGFEGEPKQHPADKLFADFGFPTLGDVERDYKGTQIRLRDYFDMVNTPQAARYFFEVVTVHGPSHPEYEQSRATLQSYTEHFAREAGLVPVTDESPRPA